MSQPITLQSALTPELLKSVLTNSLLKEIMTDAFINRGIAPMDAHDMTKPGVYRLDRPESEDPSLRSHYPSTACRAMISVFVGGDFIQQLFTAQATDESYICMKWSSGGWGPWRKIT